MKIKIFGVLIAILLSFYFIGQNHYSKEAAYISESCFYKATYDKYGNKRDAGAEYLKLCLESPKDSLPYKEDLK